MDGPRNCHAKWSQSDNETPTWNAFTDMWNLKKGQTELLCGTDADSQTLKNVWSPEETNWGVGGCAWVVGWKSCEIGLWWSLYNYRCDKFIWVIKQRLKKLIKVKIKLSCDPAIPLLSIYPEKTMTQKDTCTAIFIAMLFTIAKIQKQHKCPLTEEWIKKRWYIYTMEYYSAINRNKIQHF